VPCQEARHSNEAYLRTGLNTMSNKSEATAKDAEGKLESAYGEMTGDLGHQIKGKAKQVQASAMNAAEELKEAAKAVQKKISDTADQGSDNLK
jgi:uncharacterized protein YjbJ (UPF0337 family)